MKKITWIISLLTFVVLAANAQGPNETGTYYKRVHGKHGAALKTAFYEIIKNPSVLTYADLWDAYKISDVREIDGQQVIWDMYSSISRYPIDTKLHGNGQPEGTKGFQREHSMPKSWFNPVERNSSNQLTYNDIKPMYSDIVHVIPAEGYVNNKRSNYPYGENKGEWYKSAEDFSIMGDCTYSGYTGRCFEPNDEYKGDLARIYFYMVTCYEKKTPTWTGDYCGTWTGEMFNLDDDDSYQPFAPWALKILIEWAAKDPVSEKELARNNAIWQLQGNRNPFVDYPGLETFIWGDNADVDFSYDGTIGNIEPVIATSCDINLNKTTFGVDWSGNKNTRDYWERYPLEFEQDGITVAYNYGIEGQNMYANDLQIRMYKYNTLTFRTEANDITSIEFSVIKNDANKEFFPSVGTMDGYKWTGSAREVQFTVTDGNGNIQISNVHVEVADATDIEVVPVETDFNEPEAIYSIDGRRLETLQPGLNIVRMKNGQVKKVIVR